ncbi:MAG: hypothetical protein Q4A32_01025 [Lachnospiraceae bacterium]|nr:hypothetical protein [Lachnospiraceae bacterium]
MSEEKKKFDQKAYIADFNKKNYDRIELKVPKGMKAKWQEIARSEGVSLTECIMRRMQEA